MAGAGRLEIRIAAEHVGDVDELAGALELGPVDQVHAHQVRCIA